MTHPRQRMIEDMQLRGLIPRTQEAYVRAARAAAMTRKPRHIAFDPELAIVISATPISLTASSAVRIVPENSLLTRTTRTGLPSTASSRKGAREYRVSARKSSAERGSSATADRIHAANNRHPWYRSHLPRRTEAARREYPIHGGGIAGFDSCCPPRSERRPLVSPATHASSCLKSATSHNSWREHTKSLVAGRSLNDPGCYQEPVLVSAGKSICLFPG